MMGTKKILILSAIAAILFIVVGQIDKRTNDTDTDEKRLFIEALSDKVESLDSITVETSGNQLVAKLTRGESDWRVDSADSYPADMSKIRELVQSLVDAEIIESKTAKAEFYSRLGVEDVSDANAVGTKVTLQMSSGTIAVIVGKTATNGGIYARMGDQAQSWQLKDSITVVKDANLWLDADVLNITADRVQSVRIRHSDTESVFLEKESKSQENFNLVDLPEGRELSFESVANATGSALASLRLESVRKFKVSSSDTDDVSDSEGAVDANTTPVEIKFTTFDGVTLELNATKESDDYWVSISAHFDQSLAEKYLTDPLVPVSDDASSSEDEAPKSLDVAAIETRKEEVESINARVSGWEYKLPSYKFDNINKHLDDFLKELKDEPDDLTDESAD